MTNLARVSTTLSVALVLLLAGAAVLPPSASGAKSPGESEFLGYLRPDFPTLYNAEIKRLCVEEDEVGFCREYVDLLNAAGKFEEAISFADDLGRRPSAFHDATRLMKARGLFGAGRYAEAVAQLDTLVAGFPPEADLVDAILLRARCQFELGRAAEALLNLRALEGRVAPADRIDFETWLAKCEETSGDLQKAIKLYTDAWKSGSAEAGLGLVRCNLRQGRTEAAVAIGKEAAKRGIVFPADEAASIAVLVGDMMPALWHGMMGSVVADTAFDLDARPDLAASVVRLAESGEDTSPYSSALLGSTRSQDEKQMIRYARALGERGGPAGRDSLVVLVSEASGPEARLRFLAAAIAAAPERREELVRSAGPGLGSMAAQLKGDDRLALCAILIDCGAEDAALAELRAMSATLKAGLDDQALAEVAGLIESAGDKEGALAVCDAVAQSPVLSSTTLACEKHAYLERALVRREVDIAKEVERIAKKGASDLELGDLFMEKLGDYERASTYYAKALEAAPGEKGADATRLKLARALSLAAYSKQGAEGGTGGTAAAAAPAPSAAIELVRSVASSEEVRPEDVIAAAKLATDWLRTDQASVAELAGALSRRKDLTAASLYATANLLFALVLEGAPSYSERCSALLNRVWSDFGGSKQAPLAAFTLARLRLVQGDYADARTAFEACAAKSRDRLIASLCNLGLGECFLRSGGFAEAVGYLKKADSRPASLDIARSYEILGAPDSSLVYYNASLASPATSSYADRARLGIAMILASRSDVRGALASLDSPLPATRERLSRLRLLTAAYAAGIAGYRKVAIASLAAAGAVTTPASTEASLLAARLAADDDPEDALALLARVGSGDDFFENFEVALDRARYSCSSPAPGACSGPRDALRKRYPLQKDALTDLGARSALAVLANESPDSAGLAFVDSVIASADGSPLLPTVLYRRGVRSLVEGDYPRAKSAFAEIVNEFRGSDLYGDAAFKLGSTYYLTEQYDSSAAFFGLASTAAQPSLARDALFNWGLALEETGAFGEAADAYARLALRFPWSDEFDRALIRRGYCLQSEGRPDQAVDVYRAVLRYVTSEESCAEAGYWIGESFAQSGDRPRAACEFLRTAFLYPKQEAWAGTSAYQAGEECEKAGWPDYAIKIYKSNVRRFGKTSDWGRASQGRLDELDKASGPGGSEPVPREAPGQAPAAEQAPDGEEPPERE